MDPELLTAWTTALRSGTYTQGCGQLRQTVGDTTHHHQFCCLGVLCEVAEIDLDAPAGSPNQTWADQAGVEPSDTPPALAVLLPEADRAALADINDYGTTFGDIATWIENHLTTQPASEGPQ